LRLRFFRSGAQAPLSDQLQNFLIALMFPERIEVGIVLDPRLGLVIGAKEQMFQLIESDELAAVREGRI